MCVRVCRDSEAFLTKHVASNFNLVRSWVEIVCVLLCGIREAGLRLSGRGKGEVEAERT